MKKFKNLLSEIKNITANDMTKDIADAISNIKDIIYTDDKEFNLMKKLSDSHIIDPTNFLIQNLLFLEKYDEYDKKLINDSILWMKKLYSYNTPNNYFKKDVYDSFTDFFKRELSDNTLKTCYSTSKDSFICSPSECLVHSVGVVDDKVDIKNLSVDLKKGLSDLGVTFKEQYFYINMKLKRLFYHHVHSMVNGEIKSIKKVNVGESYLFGPNFGIILEIYNKEEKLTFYMLIIGELSVQNFIFKKEIGVGTEIKKCDEIGRFDFGSQVIFIGPKSLDKKFTGEIEEKYFLGDTLIR